MSDTLPNIKITGGVWVDLYAASVPPIAVGTKLIVENVGMCDVYLAVQATQPDPDHNDYNILKRTGSKMTNSAGDSGAWAFCGHSDGELNVSIQANNGFNAAPAGTEPVPARLTDRQGRSAKISQKGELLTGTNVDDVDVNFQYTIRSAETVSTVTGTGVISHPGASGSYAELSPGTGVGSAKLVSKAPVRYRAGHEVYCELSHVFRTPEANLNQWFGFLNGNDRWVVGYQGLDFGILFREGGNDTFIAQDDFNLDKLDGTGPSGYTIDPLTINVSRCAFVWHGGLPLTIEVQIGQQWMPVHVLDFSNIITETHLENPHLPIGGIIERTSGTGTNDAMRTGSWRGGSIAAAINEPSDDWTGHTVIDVALAAGAGIKTNLMTLVNPPTWQGKQNHIVYELGVVTFRSSGNKDLGILGLTGAVVAGGGAETFIDEANYALKFVDGGTVTGGSGGPATILGPGERDRIDVRGTGIQIYPGTQFTIAADPGAGNTVNGTFSAVSRLVHEG